MNISGIGNRSIGFYNNYTLCAFKRLYKRLDKRRVVKSTVLGSFSATAEQIRSDFMKKIPLHTIIFFYIALIPVIVFVIFLIIGIVYGDVEEVIGGIFMIVPVIACLKQGINPDILLALAFIVMFLQILAIVNFINVHKKVHEHKETQTDNNDY